MKIGIPQALFFYQFYPFWKTFFEALGCEVVLSAPTNNDTLKAGLDLAVDDACLPIKLYHGHIVELIGKVDVIFAPRIISIVPKEYICPKFLGLPDMIRACISPLPQIIDVELNLYKGRQGLYQHIYNIGKILKKSNSEIFYAYIKALKALRQCEALVRQSKLTPVEALMTKGKSQEREETSVGNKLKVLLLGHNYIIYDNFISMNLIDKLRNNNIDLITCEMVPQSCISQGTKRLSKDLFWTLGKNSLGAFYYYLDGQTIDGVIHVASFGCGPDSLVGELLEQKARREYNVPFLCLYLDEHSAEAGFDTRLEAFIDVLEGRKLYEENNLSAHG